MEDSLVINKIYSALLTKATSDDSGFSGLRGRWGFRNTDEFQEKTLKMHKGVRRLGKECPIMYRDGSYWLFDGKIYVTVREELIAAAFGLVIEFLEIIPAIGSKVYVKTFLDTIRYYNPMHESRNLIAFTNGVLDVSPILRGHEPIFHDHFDERFHVTYYHPYPYDARAKCTRWLNFLHEVLPDKNARLILQMFLGLGVIDSAEVYNPYEGKDSSRVELCLILIGSGANGKSVVYQTARGVFGKERISGIDYDELTSPGDEGMRARRLLRNALFNWSSDSDSRTFGRKRTGVFKRIVSGEPVTDRKIGEDVRENDNMPYLVFNLNELPYPDDQSLGFIRRLQFISFDVTIPKERQNKSLAQELQSVYPGIFNWVVRGARELIRRKFIFPSSEGNRRQMILAQLQSNPVVAWVNAYQMRWEPLAKNEVGVYIPTAVMVKSLEQFCEDNGADCVTRQKFGQTMARLGNGFFKRRFPEGFRYLVYGCTEERLRESFFISKENMNVDYIHEKGTFVLEDD